MDALNYRGGAKMAWVGASWPFARLLAKPGQLTLSSLGTYSFAPQDVVALEPYGSIPVLARGIRIRHNRQDCPEPLVFWCMGDRDAALEDIQRVFRPAGVAKPRAPGVAVRWSVIMVLIALSLLIMALDPAHLLSDVSEPSLGVIVILGLLLGVCSAVRTLPVLQRLFLRPGHHVGEIAPYLVLMQVVFGLQLVAFTLLYATS